MRRMSLIVAACEVGFLGGMILNDGPLSHTLSESVEEIIGLHLIAVALAAIIVLSWRWLGSLPLQ